MKLVRTIPKIDEIWQALQAGKKRQRVYPADEAAVQAVHSILTERVKVGKQLHTLTIAQIVALGFSEKTARNAIKKLKDAGVIQLVMRHRFDAATTVTFASLYCVNKRFIEEIPAKNRNDLATIWLSKGMTFVEYQTVLSQLEKESKRVTVAMLQERLEEISNSTASRLKRAAMFGGRLS